MKTSWFSTVVLFFMMSNIQSQSSKEIAGNEILWSKDYTGVIAEYHPVSISLSSDKKWITGTIQKTGDPVKYYLSGEWKQGAKVLLQERDEFDRLTGYVKGTLADDHADLEWISADRSRIFSIHVYTNRLIKIGGFKPVMEWIECSDGSFLSIQKMDFGWISGLLIQNEQVQRLDGNCQDGQCSIWSGSVYHERTKPTKLSCQQRTATTYRIVKDGKEVTGTIAGRTPLAVKAFSNANGFMDLVYPLLDTTRFTPWLMEMVGPSWNLEEKELKSLKSDHVEDRLAFRTSAWVEIAEDNDQWSSGILTMQMPDTVFRKSFIWSKKDKEVITESDWLMGPLQRDELQQTVMSQANPEEDDFGNWVRDVGYTYLLPVRYGLLTITEFDSFYGDSFFLLNSPKVKDAVKRKYSKYFIFQGK